MPNYFAKQANGHLIDARDALPNVRYTCAYCGLPVYRVRHDDGSCFFRAYPGGVHKSAVCKANMASAPYKHHPICKFDITKFFAAVTAPEPALKKLPEPWQINTGTAYDSDETEGTNPSDSALVLLDSTPPITHSGDDDSKNNIDAPKPKEKSDLFGDAVCSLRDLCREHYIDLPPNQALGGGVVSDVIISDKYAYPLLLNLSDNSNRVIRAILPKKVYTCDEIRPFCFINAKDTGEKKTIRLILDFDSEEVKDAVFKKLYKKDKTQGGNRVFTRRSEQVLIAGCWNRASYIDCSCNSLLCCQKCDPPFLKFCVAVLSTKVTCKRQVYAIPKKK